MRGKAKKNISAFADSPGIRLQKYLSSIGFNSRRSVENLIQKYKIIVNGKLAKLGLRVRDGDLIRVADNLRGKVALKQKKTRVLIYNQPVGKVCSRSRDEKFESVYDCIPQIKGAKWISVGRLDVNLSLIHI